MTRIQVRAGADVAVPTFVVTVADDDGSSTTHEVRMDRAAASLAATFASHEAFVDACFRFLLEREPKQSILRAFDLSEIGRYFPEWRDELGATT